MRRIQEQPTREQNNPLTKSTRLKQVTRSVQVVNNRWPVDLLLLAHRHDQHSTLDTRHSTPNTDRLTTYLLVRKAG